MKATLGLILNTSRQASLMENKSLFTSSDD